MSSNTRKSVGGRIRNLRQQRGWNQTEASIIFGVTQGRLSEYESGRTLPTLDTIYRIRKALGCSWKSLLG